MMNNTMMSKNINEQNITNQINDALEKKRKEKYKGKHLKNIIMKIMKKY